MQTRPSPPGGVIASNPFPADCARKFRCLHRIGAGGFGEIHHAIHIDLNCSVAIKLLLRDLLEDSEQIRRFNDEARFTASVSHPGIMRVIDSGAEFKVPWIAYEYLPGENLRVQLEKRPEGLDLRTVIDAGIQVADALEAAHAAGLIHRDIKPDNVMEGGAGQYKLGDFGIAKWTGASAVRTKSGLILGTGAYLSPEQIIGEGASPAADVYAMGVMLFELVTGKLPFWNESLFLLLEQHLKAPIPRASDSRSGIPVSLDRILERALQKSPADRYASAKSLGQDLKKVMVTLESGAHHSAAEKDRTQRFVRRAPDRPDPAARREPLASTRASRAPAVMSRLWLPAIPAAIVSLGLMVWCSQTRRPPPVTSPRLAANSSVAGVRPEPVMSGEDVHSLPKDPLFLSYQLVDSFRKRLESPRLVTRSVTRELQQRTHLALGDQPELWLQWAAIGECLERCQSLQQLKHMTHAHRGPAEKDDATGLRDRLNRAQAGPPAELLSLVVHAMCWLPDDSAPWFAFGWILDRAAQREWANPVYQYAWSRLPPTSLVTGAVISWAGLFRSASLSGQDLISVWGHHVGSDEQDPSPFAGLKLALEPDGNPYVQLLTKICNGPHGSAFAWHVLGQQLLKEGKTTAATATFRSGFGRYPTASCLVSDLSSAYMRQGRLPEAARVLAGEGAPSADRRLLKLLQDPPDLTSPIEDCWQPVLRMRQLEMGDVRTTLASVSTLPWTEEAMNAGYRVGLALELRAIGCRAPWIDQTLARSFPPSASTASKWNWDFWLGHLSYEASEPLMEAMQADTALWATRHEESNRELSRALWLSRIGRIQKSIEVTERLVVPAHPNAWPAGLVEVVCRAIWQENLGLIPKSSTAGLLVACETLGDRNIARMMNDLRGERFSEALAILNSELEKDPESPCWLVPTLQVAHLAGDSNYAAELGERGLTIARMANSGLWMIRELNDLAHFQKVHPGSTNVRH